MARIGIAGAGVLGRLIAWLLGNAGHTVTVFDPAPGPHPPAARTLTSRSAYAASFTAAGMLSPIAELENTGPAMARLGWRSLAIWRGIAEQLRGRGCISPLFAQNGSLLLAQGSDLGAARRMLELLDSTMPQVTELPVPQALTLSALAALEPAVAQGLHAWFLPEEAQIMSSDMLTALVVHAVNVHWCWADQVKRVEPGRIILVDGDSQGFDFVIDVRGVGASADIPVRGVRGEVVWLHAPGLHLRRPVRLLHPRHRVYIVPRPGDIVVVGASEMESDDRSPVSLGSAVEMMAAAQSAVPDLAQARIVHLEANLRPAMPNNEPFTHAESGLLRINGLFRHGWLIAPALVEDSLMGSGLL